LSASNVLDVVDGWWRVNPNANIGLATDDLIVVDVDTRKGGSDTLATLEREHGALPATWRSFTGGGGEHVFFHAPDGLRIKNSVERVGPGIDIRATGGYVIAPPSLHISGRRYAWNVDYHPDLTPLAYPPAWLCKLAGDAPPSPTSGARAPPSVWQNIAACGVSEGARNDAIARMCGHLLRHFVDPNVALELMSALNLARFRPPLSEDEVRRVVASIASAELRRRKSRDGHR
jgi:hypothetical protein